MKACECWDRPVRVFEPDCYAEHCCFRTDERCHDDEMRPEGTA